MFWSKVIIDNNFVLFLTLTVSGNPTGFNATRLSSRLAHIRLSSYTVSGATGYEVYFQLSSNTPVSIVNTTDTTVDITSGLASGNNYIYIFYVVFNVYSHWINTIILTILALTAEWSKSMRYW